MLASGNCRTVRLALNVVLITQEPEPLCLFFPSSSQMGLSEFLQQEEAWDREGFGLNLLCHLDRTLILCRPQFPTYTIKELVSKFFLSFYRLSLTMFLAASPHPAPYPHFSSFLPPQCYTHSPFSLSSFPDDCRSSKHVFRALMLSRETVTAMSGFLSQSVCFFPVVGTFRYRGSWLYGEVRSRGILGLCKVAI